MASHLERLVYLNGDYVRGSEAKLSIFDRGLLFADAVYEGLGIRAGRVVDSAMHLARLRRSLAELGMAAPLSEDELQALFQTLIDKNNVREGFLYLHVTRGEGDRDYVYQDGLQANVFAFVQPAEGNPKQVESGGVTLVSHVDLRWQRRDIKTSNLLAQVMAKNAADRAGSYEALLVDGSGRITEGGATSFFIIRAGKLFARPLTQDILHGITRQAMLRIAADHALEIVEETFSLEDAYAADEAFITGASTYIEPVVQIDGRPIGDSKPGPVTIALRRAYFELFDAGEL